MSEISPEDQADRAEISDNELLRQMSEHEAWPIWKKYLYGQLSVQFEHFLTAPAHELIEHRGAARALYNILEIVDGSEERRAQAEHRIQLRHETAMAEEREQNREARRHDLDRVRSMGVATL